MPQAVLSPVSFVAASCEPRPLYLTEQEALALLELCLVHDENRCPISRQTLSGLAEVCREFLRTPSNGTTAEERRCG